MKHRHPVAHVVFLLLLVLALVPATGYASPATGALPASSNAAAQPPEPDLARALRQDTQGNVYIATRAATGVASHVRVEPGQDLLPDVRLPEQARTPEGKAFGFFRLYGGLFGIRDAAAELAQVAADTDRYGMRTLTYRQTYRGLPVFAGELRVHLDSDNRLRAINGVFVPDIAIGTAPRLSAGQAAERALQLVLATPRGDWENGEPVVTPTDLAIASTTLLIYRDGLIQDVPGPDYLAYEVEVTNRRDVREFVYVDANTGKVINHYSAVPESLYRRLFEQNTGNQVWQEGDPFPGSLNLDQQNIVNFSGNAYYFFFNAFARDSYNAAGAEMRSVNNDPRINCPNANWNGLTTNYCTGVTADDVVAHEWGHAYTEYTSGLIYQWQPGALNESYSDIWGEVVDMLNGAGTDAPVPVRTVNSCTIYSAPIPILTVNAPPSIAGNYAAGAATFGPPVTAAGTTGDTVLANDGSGVTTDACEPLINTNMAGKIALVDRGTCAFTIKVKNAQNAGAIGVIVADNVAGPVAGMAGSDPTIIIPSLRVTLDTGNLLKANLATLNTTLRAQGSGAPEDSYRWLMGEDATAFNGAIRDMWNPTCFADPGKVSDQEYYCASSDAGGVHTNSGVPNHGFSLLVDGGTYNGRTIPAIGLTKAAHIYWRAQAEYQTPATGFAGHADALVAACQDLIGANLEGLSTSATPAGPSGEVITAADCAAVSAMTDAVELRSEPLQCNFQPLLAKNPPALCAGAPAGAVTVFGENFEAGLANWTLENQGVYAGWPNFDWVQAATLPGGRAGAAAFATDPIIGTCAGDAGDISGVFRMTTPAIVIPNDPTLARRLAFEHYVATEDGWDGGNLQISINGGPFTAVPASAFLYNPYNTTLQTAAGGNTNPLAGQRAFSGTDGGKLTGSWGQSQIDLTALGVAAGDTIRLRYSMGLDGCNGVDGWYVDDVNVYTCGNYAPGITVAAGGQCNSTTSGTVSLALTDPGGDPAALVLSATSSNTALIPNANITFGGSGASRTMQVTAAARQSGQATITVRVTDAEGRYSEVLVQVIVGTNDPDTLTGTAGADIIFGLNGDDTVSAGDGNDLICAGNGNSIVDGGAGDDTLDGQNGNDRLSGGDGSDRLYGNRGNDTLTGGPGADFFSGGQGTDTATDFSAAEGDTGDGTIP